MTSANGWRHTRHFVSRSSATVPVRGILRTSQKQTRRAMAVSRVHPYCWRHCKRKRHRELFLISFIQVSLAFCWKWGECFVAKGISMNRESKRRVRPKNKSNKFIKYLSVLICVPCRNRKLLTEQCRVERPLLACLWFKGSLGVIFISAVAFR
jgi:hypothetical protein